MQALFQEPYKQNFIFFITYEKASMSSSVTKHKASKVYQDRESLLKGLPPCLTSLDLPILKMQS